MANEGQAANVLCSVEPSSATGARWRGDEVDPLVISNRLDIDAGTFGQGSDSDHGRLIL